MLAVKLCILFAALWGGVFSLKDQSVLGMRSLHVVSDIRFRFARTRIVARFHYGTSFRNKFAVFHVTLPNSALVTDFRYTDDTREFVGKIKERSSVIRRRHESRGDNGVSSMVGSKNPKGTNKFKVLVYALPYLQYTFNLTYEEVLQRKDGKYEHQIFISPELPVDDMRIDVAVHESRDMTNFQSYLRKESGADSGREHIGQLDVRRPDSKSAVIQYKPSRDQLTHYEKDTSARLVVSYDFDRAMDGGEVLVFKDYFIHFFAPEVLTPIPRDVLFILDTSTSMALNKLDQVKAAMKVILDDLGSEDRFNIISFGSRVNFWRKNLAEARKKIDIQEALTYLDDLEALGWTNIMDPLSQGLSYMTNVSRPGQGMVIFLTDGRAVSGETSTRVISEVVRKANQKDIPVYTLAFGKDADWQLMKKLAFQNSGTPKKIYADDSAATQIEKFYGSISSSGLHGITFRNNGNVTNSTQSKFTLYTTGSELVVAGPTSNVKSITSGGETALKPKIVDVKRDLGKSSSKMFPNSNLGRRMWIHLRVKDILKAMAKEPLTDTYEKLGQEATKIAWRHQLLTPVTALEVETNFVTHFMARAQYREDTGAVYYLGEQPMAKYYTQYDNGYYGSSRVGGYGDPHFMVYMSGLQYPICFDVNGKDDEMYQLVRDPQTDFMVNARMRNGKRKDKRGKSRLYYMTEFNIKLRDLHLHITCQNVTLDGMPYNWNQNVNGTLSGANFYLNVISDKINRLSIVFESKLEIDVHSHIHKHPSRPGHDFLNIEIGNEHVLSKETDGLLGQFVRKHMRLNDLTFRKGYLVAELESRSGVDTQHGRARIVHRKDPIWNTTTSCWMIKKMGSRLLDGPAEYYVIKSMNQTDLI